MVVMVMSELTTVVTIIRPELPPDCAKSTPAASQPARAANTRWGGTSNL